MLRDRRTMFFMIVFPLLFLPLVTGGFPYLMNRMETKNMTGEMTIALIGADYAPVLADLFKAGESIKIVEDHSENDIVEAIKNGSIKGAVIIHQDFSINIESMDPAEVELYFRSSEDMDATKRRLQQILDAYSASIRSNRYEILNLQEEVFNPLNVSYNNIASDKEMVGKMAGGWLPYVFILYCFMGAMNPALDLGAGEKERATLETILASPASRLEILFGKFGVIALFGIISALMGLVGMLAGVRLITHMPPEIQQVISEIINLKTVLVILSLITPVAIFFAALLLTLSIYAKTFKEAQSIIAPLNIIIIFPVLLGMIPGIELNAITALIPILNISLATKEFLAGTVQPLLWVEVYMSLIVYALLAILLTKIQFERESVIFRG